MTRRALAGWFLMTAIAGAGPAAAQTSGKQEIEVRATTLTLVQTRLTERLNAPGAFELHARGIKLTHEQAKAFFTPAGTSSSGFGGLVTAIQRHPGAEVKLQGTVDGRPFEAKVQTGEVKIRGLALSPTDFNTLVRRLNTGGARELKVHALVDGKAMIAKVENERDRPQTRTEKRGDNRGPGSDGRGGARAARDQRPERERIDRSDRIERNERTERVERVERTERADRGDRADRIDRVDRSGRH